ncbi:MAG: hypothetical protein FWE42_02780 [Defluviitaleaceae bacterium]|nr:hypothetical protein [Defluviitaleaceae bacterium]
MKKIIMTAIVWILLFIFASCGGEAEELPYQGIESTLSYGYEAAPALAAEPAPTPEPLLNTYETEEKVDNGNYGIVGVQLPVRCRDEILVYTGISEYGWQVAADFLRGFTSIFTEVRRLTPTENTAAISFIETHSSPYAFFDRYSNVITGQPWIYTQRFESYWNGEYSVSYAHNYADYFSLFDFDNTGIPDIIIHFAQTFCGCYGGFYQIFRYENGAYRMLEITSFVNGEKQNWVNFGTIHELFVDDTGRIISFINCVMNGAEYDHLILGSHGELHRITDASNYDWDYWQAHHWEDWEPIAYGHNLVSSWRDYNPSVISTDIMLTQLLPFEEFGVKLYLYISYIFN